MRLCLANWMSVEALCLELAPVTVLVGGVGAGKSSVALAAYFLARAAAGEDPAALADSLFGGLSRVARAEGGRPVYPVSVEAGEAYFNALSDADYAVGGPAPWRAAYLLPAGRLPSLRRMAEGRPPCGDGWTGQLAGLLADLPRTPLSDGALDSAVLELAAGRAPEGSLLAVEEPEAHKPAAAAMRSVAALASAAAGRGHTLLMTTGGPTALRALLAAVASGGLRPQQVAVYLLERRPWTAARRLAVHRDATMDWTPELEEVVKLIYE